MCNGVFRCKWCSFWAKVSLFYTEFLPKTNFSQWPHFNFKNSNWQLMRFSTCSRWSTEYIVQKASKYWRFPGLYFYVFGLNLEIDGFNMGIQSKYGEIPTRKKSVFGHFLRSDKVTTKLRTLLFDYSGLTNQWSSIFPLLPHALSGRISL